MSKPEPCKRLASTKLQDFATEGGGSFRSVYAPQSAQTAAGGGDASYGGFLLDVDGVLHRNHVPVDGASEFLKKLKSLGIPFILLTNECRYTNEGFFGLLGLYNFFTLLLGFMLFSAFKIVFSLFIGFIGLFRSF